MPTFTSACPLDCPDSCSLEVEVEEGRIASIRGTRHNPLTQGFICSKVRRLPRHVYGEERLRHPAVRRGAKGEALFEPISWDEALDLLAARLREVRDRSGGEAILPLCYGGSNGLLTQDTTDARLFQRLGASRLARTVCAAPSGRALAGLYGRMPGVPLEHYEAASLIIVWGANPSATHIHLVPIIKRAREKGARLVVVDPRTTPLAKGADLHLAVRPGTDLAVALALIRALFEEGGADPGFLETHATGGEDLRRRAADWTFDRAADVAGLEAAQIEAFYDLYRSCSPAVIRCGWGLERNRNGGSAVAAVLALPAVAGKFGVQGGGYTMSNSAVWRTKGLGDPGAPNTRTVNMNRTGEALLELDDPPVELLFVYNANPLMTLPNQERVRLGLLRSDLFTVVFDQVMTDTARYADLLLPATTFLEHHDVAKGYGAQVLHAVRPVIEPEGEARPNYQVFAELIERLGLDREGDSSEPQELVADLFEGQDGIRTTLEAGEVARPEGARVQFVDVFPETGDRKVHLFPQELDREAPDGLYAYRQDPGTATYPLALISPATSRTVSSTFGQLVEEPAELLMHPADARGRGLDDGGAGDLRVRVFNELGEVRCRLRLSSAVRRGVVLLPKGLWSHQTEGGSTANAVAPDTLTDLGGGACFNDARVEVEPIVED